MNMIRTTKHLSTLLLAGVLTLSAVSCDEGDEFYTENYAIVAVDVIVEATTQTPDEDGEAAEDPRLEQIRAEVMAASPVEAGGGYTLHFTEYNGGPLDIVTTAGAAPLAGAFRKVPGSTTLEFIYGGEERIYTLGSYRAEDQRTKIVLQLDLTSCYRTLYPDAGITRAIRREYTSHNY